MKHIIRRRELFFAQVALFVAIALQITVWQISHNLFIGPQFLIIATEFLLAVLIGFTINIHGPRIRGLHHAFSVGLLGLISLANASSLILVLNSLITGNSRITGTQLLGSAVAIFLNNVIVFALWYWEIDSPGLSRTLWTRQEQDFQFTQQDFKKDFPGWEPEFLDYMYLSLTNAINFASADARPLTHFAKTLMGTQALVSVFTLALIIARTVYIVGN